MSDGTDDGRNTSGTGDGTDDRILGEAGMNERQNDNLDPARMSIAELLRAAADEELCPDGRRCLEEHLGAHPEAASQVEFERALKRCCERVMTSEPCCPEALRAKIGAMAVESRGEEAAGSVVESMQARTAQRSFWARSPMMGALAAVLVLAGGALIYQSVGVATSPGAGGGSQTTPVEYAERVGNFVAREHARCSVDQAASAKFDERDLSEAVDRFASEFARPVMIPSTVGAEIEESGIELEFFGGGACHLPSTSGSAHLRFDARRGAADGADEPIRVSLFIAPDPGLLGIEEGVTYKVASKACIENGESLYVWTEGGVLYLLVSEADETLCAPVRTMMRAPGEVRSL